MENNLKWIINVNVKHKTIKLPEDYLGENLNDLGYGDALLDAAPKTRSMKKLINMLNIIKIKNFGSGKDQYQEN